MLPLILFNIIIKSTPQPISSSLFYRHLQTGYSDNAHTAWLWYVPDSLQSALHCQENKTQAMIPRFSGMSCCLLEIPPIFSLTISSISCPVQVIQKEDGVSRKDPGSMFFPCQIIELPCLSALPSP